jgi:hypothetical protein
MPMLRLKPHCVLYDVRGGRRAVSMACAVRWAAGGAQRISRRPLTSTQTRSSSQTSRVRRSPRGSCVRRASAQPTRRQPSGTTVSVASSAGPTPRRGSRWLSSPAPSPSVGRACAGARLSLTSCARRCSNDDPMPAASSCAGVLAPRKVVSAQRSTYIHCHTYNMSLLFNSQSLVSQAFIHL